MKPKSNAQKMLEFADKQALIRPSDLRLLEIPRSYLYRLVSQGKLIRVQRGLYTSTKTPPTAHQSLIEVSRRVPRAVICLASALRFYELTTQSPQEVWIAIDVKGRKPQISYPPIRVVWLSGRTLTFGIREHLIDGVRIRVYSPAKTVADCFKFRNKIGLDIAIEALREVYRQKKATTDELWEAAKVCRVSKVMLPYMESLV